MTANEKLRVLAHHGGTYSGLQVTLPHRECGHLMTVPTATLVTRTSLPHLGQGMSISTARFNSSRGPSTMDACCDMLEISSANVKEHAPLAAASVDHGVEGKTTEAYESRAADRGCVSRLVRCSSLSSGDVTEGNLSEEAVRTRPESSGLDGAEVSLPAEVRPPATELSLQCSCGAKHPLRYTRDEHGVGLLSLHHAGELAYGRDQSLRAEERRAKLRNALFGSCLNSPTNAECIHGGAGMNNMDAVAQERLVRLSMMHAVYVRDKGQEWQLFSAEPNLECANTTASVIEVTRPNSDCCILPPNDTIHP